MNNLWIEFSVILCIPILNIIIGIVWRCCPPRKVNWWYGYRTTRSMKSQTAWDFAQSYGARVMLRVGIMLLLLSLGYYLVLVFEISDPANWGVLFYAVTQLVAFCVACILPVERALKRNFDKYGNRAVNAK